MLILSLIVKVVAPLRMHASLFLTHNPEQVVFYDECVYRFPSDRWRVALVLA